MVAFNPTMKFCKVPPDRDLNPLESRGSGYAKIKPNGRKVTNFRRRYVRLRVLNQNVQEALNVLTLRNKKTTCTLTLSMCYSFSKKKWTTEKYLLEEKET